MKVPMQFRVFSSSESGIQTVWEGKMENLDPITMAIPPDFNGPGGGYSPEDLFALSGLTCLIATFKVYAEKTEASYEEISGFADLIIDKPEKGPLAITKLEINVAVKGAKDKEKIKKLLEEAKRSCLVANAMKIDLQFTFDVK
ncbi:MAG: hypothetical protein Tsb0015_02930 [Simkaniaceae bacterium]